MNDLNLFVVYRNTANRCKQIMISLYIFLLYLLFLYYFFCYYSELTAVKHIFAASRGRLDVKIRSHTAFLGHVSSWVVPARLMQFFTWKLQRAQNNAVCIVFCMQQADHAKIYFSFLCLQWLCLSIPVWATDALRPDSVTWVCLSCSLLSVPHIRREKFRISSFSMDTGLWTHWIEFSAPFCSNCVYVRSLKIHLFEK